MKYQLFAFDQLTTQQLYDLLALRAEVFVVEQTSPYMDFDFLDQQALHLCLFDGDKLAGYARILKPGLKFKEASVGRVVLSGAYRGKGLGRELMQRGMDEAMNTYRAPLRIEAQQHLQPFYESLGFARVSDPYDWGGIPHVKMVCEKKAA